MKQTDLWILHTERDRLIRALTRLREEYFVAGGEMTTWEAVDVIVNGLGYDPLSRKK